MLVGAGLETVVAGVTPLLFVLLLGGPYIGFLRKRYMGQYIREDGPQAHLSKAGTPTAGGVLILLAMLSGVLALAWLHPDQWRWTPAVLGVVGVTMLFGLLGFVDDYLKIAKKQNKGVSGYTKLMVQVLAGLGLGWLVLQQDPSGSIDLMGWASLPLGWLYPLFAAFVVTGASNAVNLTDGLDGLASGTAMITLMTLFLMLYGAQAELALLALILAMACMGFLVFNRYPARVFMGDTGSLALGGALGALAVMGRVEMWLALLAVVFIVETLSVMLQVASFKWTGKRLFRMSPLHHHFELGGWHETKVVFLFVTAQFFCCVLAFFLYNKGV